jgi:FkbM family methyltransferase
MWQTIARSSFLLKCQLQLHAYWLRLSRQDYQYQIGPFTLALPPEHALPRYQAQYPLYDKFLTTLAAQLPAQSRVIDVGANCGDSAAAMLSGNPQLDVLCIEADPMFGRYLQTNLTTLAQQCPDAQLHWHQALVGLQIGAAGLTGSGGTRKAMPVTTLPTTSAAVLHTETLDTILQKWPTKPVSLLKIDVDGYDFDVLDSASHLISTQRPLLFFEYQCDHVAQQQGYQRTLLQLAAQGYQHWLLFDNFGQLILSTGEPAVLFQLQAYICQQRPLNTAGKIEYFDILAATAEHSALIEKILQQQGHQ